MLLNNVCNQYDWTLWFDSSNFDKICFDWNQLLMRITNFKNIEEFFFLINNILYLTDIPLGSSYHIFKNNIEPSWEDQSNKNGGKWILLVAKNIKHDINKIWEKSIIFALAYEDNLLVNGIVGSVKKNHVRISIWTSKCDDKCKQLNLGKNWYLFIKNFFGDLHFKLEFSLHKN